MSLIFYERGEESRDMPDPDMDGNPGAVIIYIAASGLLAFVGVILWWFLR